MRWCALVMLLVGCGGGVPCSTLDGPATCWPSSGPEWWCELDAGGEMFQCKEAPHIFQCYEGPYAGCVKT